MSTFDARLERRRLGPRSIAGVALAFALAAAIVAVTHGSPRADSRAFGISVAIELVLAALAYAWWVVRRIPHAIRTPVHVRATHGELRLDDETIAASELGDGVVQHVDSAMVVRIARRRRHAIDLVVANVDEGHALLRALGKDASQSVVRFHAGSRLFAYGAPLFAVLNLLGAVAACVSVIAHTATPLLAFLLVTVLGFAWPSRVDVGPDGIRHEWLGWSKFIPSTRIGSIEDAKFGVRTVGLLVACGEEDPHEIHVMGASRDALEQRIRDIAGQTPAADAPSVLARGGMPAREWIAALRALASPATYRNAAFDVEELWRVVESASAAREDRAAAAIAVARNDEARARLRIAAVAIAEPKLRVAIEAAASEDAEMLEQALDDLREL